MNLVSVVIPSYNHSCYIKQAVESVLGQSYQNVELIVIDDGSTDNSLEYLQSVKDERYKLIKQKNTGAHTAINIGLSHAQGDYLAILNSDDVFHPERIAACSKQLDDGVDLVATWIEVIDHNGKVLGIKEGWNNMLPWECKQDIRSNNGLDDFSKNLLMTNFVSTTSNVVFSRRLYEKIGGMRNLRFAHDWDFLLRAARHFKCELIEVPLLQYRIHQTNTISSNRAWMLFEICWIFAVHLQYFTEKMFPHSTCSDNISDKIDFLAQSINLQGNEKVMWMLLQYINEREKLGDTTSAETLISDEHLRSEFIRYIVS